MAGKTTTLERSERMTPSPSIVRQWPLQPLAPNEWKEDERFSITSRGSISVGPIRINVGLGLSERIEKITHGTNNLTNIAWLSRGLELSRAVARIRTPQGSGSGLLIGSDRLLTSHHLIPDSSTAAESVAEFDRQRDWNGQLAAMRSCRLASTAFQSSEKLDYSIVQLEGNPGDEFGYFDVADHGIPAVNDYVTLIQHSLGGLKQIGLTDNKVARIDGNFLQYITNSEPGSSGSPVFDQNWRIVALQQKGGGLAARDGQAHYINQGVLLNGIVRDARESLDLPDMLHDMIFNELWPMLVNVVHAEESFVPYVPILADDENFRRGLAQWIALNFDDTETENHRVTAPLLAAVVGVAAGAAIRHWGGRNDMAVESSKRVSSELIELIGEAKAGAELPSQIYYDVLSKIDQVKRIVPRVVEEARSHNGTAETSQLDLLAFDELGFVPATKLPVLATAFLAGITAGAAAYDGEWQ